MEVNVRVQLTASSHVRPTLIAAAELPARLCLRKIEKQS